MTENKRKNNAESWRSFWTGAEAANQSVSAGAKDEALDEFWAAFISEQLRRAPRSMIDLACGAGPVSARAMRMATAAGVPLLVHYTDYAAAAVASVRAALGGGPLAGFAADAAALPTPDGAYDIASSQFGLEYAGMWAFKEAARILRPGGVFAAVIHLRGGGIEEESAANLNIIQKAQALEFLPRARAAFEAGFAALSGRGSRAALQSADKAFAATVKATKTLITDSPAVVARAFLARLYADLAHMYPRMRAYAPEDIEAWLARGEFELKAYEHRMASMIGAAQSRADIERLAGALSGAGLNPSEPAILELGEPLKPAAWALIAEKPA
ncbi:MAG: methyltransferase domain-containing protein [Pseudomonadota bacterium]